MQSQELQKQTKEHLDFLCSAITERRVGSQGNREATDYAKKEFSKYDWTVNETELSVIDWETSGASLHCGSESFEVFSSPYSLGCFIEGELLSVDTMEKLEKSSLKGKIVLLHGPIAAEQIMPKNFVFYNPEEHQKLISILEQGQPVAIISATERNSACAGGVYPFPLFEDGDFNIPSVFMKDTEGEKLLKYTGKNVRLKSQAKRIPEKAYNIVARTGNLQGKKIVISAHIDAKIGTPGAIDNATGVTVLFLLAQLLKDYQGPYCLELAAFNGEDYYAVPGQMKYIEQNHDNFGNVALNINIDGAGYHEGPTAFSPFGVPDAIQQELSSLFGKYEHIESGLPWVQSDHSIFIQYGCPAIAVSSKWFIENMETQQITHTPGDNLSIVNYDRVTECALAIGDLIKNLR